MVAWKILESDMGGITLNKVILMGRLTKDPDVRYSQGENASAVARYTLAVDRRFQKEGEDSADFIPCVCFGRTAEFTEKYLHKGSKIAITGRIQTGRYTNKNGDNVFTTDVVVEECEFAESKATSEPTSKPAAPVSDPNGFMNIPDSDLENLPFN